MVEVKESEFHSCICFKLEKLTFAEELGQSWKSISVCISFEDYEKNFKIHKKDLPVRTEIINVPKNTESQVERDLEESEGEFRIEMVDVRSTAIPISSTNSNQLSNSNDQVIDVSTTEIDIKSEINQTELELPTHLEVSPLSTNSTFKIEKTDLFSLPTENGNVPENAVNQVEQNLEEPEGQNNSDQQSETTPILPTTSNQDSNDQSTQFSTTRRYSRRKRNQTDLGSASDAVTKPTVSPLPTCSTSRTKNRPKVKPLINRISTSATQNKANECPTCRKQFSDKRYLVVHQKMMHSDEQWKANWSYECDICSKKFMNLKDLNSHKMVHSNDRKFKCSNCPTTFKWKGDFSRHLKTHEKDSPFRCKMCDIVLSSLRNLESHIRTHTGEKPYQCQICDISFARKWDLKIHMLQAHSP